MPDILSPPPEQFLREDAIRGGMDLMLFAHSRHLQHADEELAKLNLGRAHHRVLYFLARKPDMPVNEILTILAITKQSFGRVANALTEQGLMESRPGDRDRRQRLLRLTPAGAKLEQDLFIVLHDNMARAYGASGGQAVAGFWVVMQHLMGTEAQSIFARIQRA
ncbi:MarR family transcriptional regulator [Sphingomonas ginsenosidivorax]|uniref:MarR family transcriptional regulator n=1 Tax=Sphingomonas ginsenosidivorax TaxID=862135 RepID=A0A5C6UFR3_9SPHN|nr:helix-turn-helix domain-containing protein [Sphingomonas ginsenosidivorax]TXC71539.1 MarR family transcriptional regulator [Sphingomonas ginsenosidivorax]